MDHNVHGFKEVGVVVVGAIPLLYYYYTIRTIFTSDFDPPGESEAACPSPLGVRPPPSYRTPWALSPVRMTRIVPRVSSGGMIMINRTFARSRGCNFFNEWQRGR